MHIDCILRSCVRNALWHSDFRLRPSLGRGRTAIQGSRLHCDAETDVDLAAGEGSQSYASHAQSDEALAKYSFTKGEEALSGWPAPKKLHMEIMGLGVRQVANRDLAASGRCDWVAGGGSIYRASIRYSWAYTAFTRRPSIRSRPCR
jgi:hypothetical protein